MATNHATSVVKHLCRVLAHGQSTNLSDAQLLESFVKRGDQTALEVLVHRHGPMVMGACRRLLNNRDDAEDAFQATFLILVRKAASIIKGDSVAGWLYAVARKTALRARGMAAKRRGNESQVNPMPELAVFDQPSNEVQRVLDDELSLLPEKYRDPIVLCHIEGKTLKEAAQQLRCPEGTVSGRLSRGRAQLSKRLARRGVVVPTAALMATLAQNATAAVPARVVSGAVEAATLLMTGQAAALAATKSAILMDAVLRGMLLAKLKIAGYVLVLAMLTVGAGTRFYQAAVGTPENVAHAEKPIARAEQPIAQVEQPMVRAEQPIVAALPPVAAAEPVVGNDEPDEPEMPPAAAPVGLRLLAKATIPAAATDLSRLDYGVGSNCNVFGGISGIAYTGKDNLYILLPDCGPADGTTDYLCRFHTMKITVKGDVLTTSLKATTLLRDEMGRPLMGALTALAPTDKIGGRLDPEGVRVSARGTIYVSDEYGPFIDEFDQQGKRLRRLPVPARFQVQHSDADPTKELKRNSIGRVPNRGMEGLALSADGRKLVGIMQSPLIQEGGRSGTNVRILEIDVATEKTREFLYPLQDKNMGVSEILAINDHEFLVLERGGSSKKRAPFCKLFKIDISRATEIQHLEKLPVKGVPKGVVPVAKELFLDLHDPKFGFKGGEIPTKVEGLAFGPDLPDGSRLLLVVTDNDFVAGMPTSLFAFAFDRASLTGAQGLAAAKSTAK